MHSIKACKFSLPPKRAGHTQQAGQGKEVLTVLPPTMMASDLARASKTSLRESGQDTHEEWPLLQAILPSAVMAYFSSDRGRPVAALCSSACKRTT